MALSSNYQPRLAGFFFPLAVVAFLLAIVAVAWLIVGGGSSALLLLLAALGGSFLAGWVSLHLSFAREFDDETRRVFSLISFGKRQWRRSLCRFDEIAAFSVKGVQNRAHVKTWWEYQPVMLLVSGRLVEVARPVSVSIFEADRQAKKFADLIGCKHFPGEPGKTIKIAIAGTSPVIEFRDWGWLDVIYEFGPATIATLFFFAAIVAFIVSMVVILS